MSVGRSSEHLVGSELAGYRVEVLIGRGGMGAVYRAAALEAAGVEHRIPGISVVDGSPQDLP